MINHVIIQAKLQKIQAQFRYSESPDNLISPDHLKRPGHLTFSRYLPSPELEISGVLDKHKCILYIAKKYSLMKKALISLLFCFTIVMCAQPMAAQKSSETPSLRGSEITISYGNFTSSTFFMEMASLTEIIVTLGLVQDNINITNPTGVVSFTYLYNFNKLIALGGSLGYEYASGYLTNSKGITTGNIYMNFANLAVECDFTYRVWENVKLYGMVGLAATWLNANYSYSDPSHGNLIISSVIPNLQVTPFGIRFGKQVGGFMEIGFGYKGWVNAGLSVKLNKMK
jgi:opacity protein-like surface antigen